MSDDERKRAMISLAIFIFSGFMLLVSLVLFVIFRGTISLPDEKIIHLIIPYDKTSCLAIFLAIGSFFGLIFGVMVNPKRRSWDKGKNVGCGDVIISLVSGVLIGYIAKDFFNPLAFTFSFITICRLIITARYFRYKY